MMESIKLDNGKYEVVVNQTKDKFEFYANRYNENHWRNLIGDGMVLAMFYLIQELESKNDKLEHSMDAYGDWWECKDCGHYALRGHVCYICGYDPTNTEEEKQS